MNNIDDRFELLLFETVQERDERRAKQKAERDKKLKAIEDEGICEMCGHFGERTKEDCEWIPSMTAYVWDKDKNPERDPNRDFFLCSLCSEEYCENMKEMWEAARGQY